MQNKFFLYFFFFINYKMHKVSSVTGVLGIISIILGIWLTVVGFEKVDPKWEPKEVINLKQKLQLKYLGPSLIVIGLILSGIAAKLYHYYYSTTLHSSSNFGFKFY